MLAVQTDMSCNCTRFALWPRSVLNVMEALMGPYKFIVAICCASVIIWIASRAVDLQPGSGFMQSAMRFAICRGHCSGTLHHTTMRSCYHAKSHEAMWWDCTCIAYAATDEIGSAELQGSLSCTSNQIWCSSEHSKCKLQANSISAQTIPHTMRG